MARESKQIHLVDEITGDLVVRRNGGGGDCCKGRLVGTLAIDVGFS